VAVPCLTKRYKKGSNIKLIITEWLNKKAYLAVLAVAVVANVIIIATVTQFGPNALYL